jgi:hypothetical protein
MTRDDDRARRALELVLTGLPARESSGRTPGSRFGAGSGAPESVLDALVALHELRGRLTDWEPALIAAARERGVAWADIAPALGVTSRQAAERRYLRLRPHEDTGLTREERVRAARDERAGDRAVAGWARQHASTLRQVAGQASAVENLPAAGRRQARALRSSLQSDDPAALIGPLTRMQEHLVGEHATLADQILSISRRARRVREQSRRTRGQETAG